MARDVNAAWYAAMEARNVSMLDWYNLTLRAPTSDGYHGLTDINVLKNAHVLHFASQALSERRFWL